MNKSSIAFLTLAYVFLFAYFGPVVIDPSSAGEPGQEASAAPSEGTAFSLPGAAGGQIDLASYAGKPVLVMFFTETCPYCRKAGPAIEKLYRTYGAKGLNVVGINIDDSPEGALGFARDLSVTFPLAYGGSEVYRNYRAQGVPYIYLLGRDHAVLDVWEGYDESYDAEMKKAIEKLLSGK